MSTVRDQERIAQQTDRALRAEVTSKANCADGALDPDQWFPVSVETDAARREAAGAIAICMACPVREACLELSLRHWIIGQHGVWGGLVPAERAELRRANGGAEPGRDLARRPRTVTVAWWRPRSPQVAAAARQEKPRQVSGLRGT
jgi:hypothetical protein